MKIIQVNDIWINPNVIEKIYITFNNEVTNRVLKEKTKYVRKFRFVIKFIGGDLESFGQEYFTKKEAIGAAENLIKEINESEK